MLGIRLHIYRVSVHFLNGGLINKNRLSHTHLDKLEGLLPVQPVGEAEGIRSVFLVELTQQLGKASVDIVFTILGFQALRTAREDLRVTKTH